MLDRTTPPVFTTNFGLTLQPIEVHHLNNRIPVYSLFSDNLDVFRLEFVFPYGKSDFNRVGESDFFKALLTKGTFNKTADQVAEGFESLGGFLSVNQDIFKTTLCLYGLTENFWSYLPLLKEIIDTSSFPQTELDLAKKQTLQSYEVNIKKPDYAANEAFKSLIYDSGSVLSQSLTPEKINEISRPQLIEYYEGIIKNKSFEIFLCGNIPQDGLECINTSFGVENVSFRKDEGIVSPIYSKQKVNLKLGDSVQGTVILGKWMFNQQHPHFIPFFVTNTILGGYFGSRLMKNIREEKGLTYGISSRLISLRDNGFFKLTTHLNKDKISEALIEINKEIDILKSQRVGDEELDTVISYIKGSILADTNTVFDIMDKHKTIHFNSLDSLFYEDLIQKVNKITSDDVMEMANKYLNDFSEVIVD